MIVQQGDKLLETSWSNAWTSVNYKRKIIIASLLFITVLLYYPHFFLLIQQRPGTGLNDPLLNVLPSLDVSPYIFLLIYLTVGLGIFRCAQSPHLFLLFLWSCLFLSLARMITMSLAPLNPPVGLVPLSDPILKPFYGPNNITKDLFFSGHTSSVFLIYLVLRKKWEKFLALIATVSVGILLLIQHIHYTIDVVFAPLFVYIVFVLAKRVTAFQDHE
jgi:hypothetical protein